MKKSLVLVVCGLAAIVCGSAQAQVTVGGHNMAITRQARQNLRQAIQLCHQAHKLMEAGLPVYDGHRVEAMRLIHSAMVDMHARTSMSVPPVFNKPPSNMKEGHDISKYGAPAIQESNNNLIQAGNLITQAGQTFQAYNYGTQVRLLTQAINQLKTALAMYPGNQ